jgi:hypothetical protein
MKIKKNYTDKEIEAEIWKQYMKLGKSKFKGYKDAFVKGVMAANEKFNIYINLTKRFYYNFGCAFALFFFEQYKKENPDNYKPEFDKFIKHHIEWIYINIKKDIKK